jgi:hypothetical protein
MDNKYSGRKFCSICGDMIHNRGLYNSYKDKYAHQGCVEKEYGTVVEWESYKERK